MRNGGEIGGDDDKLSPWNNRTEGLTAIDDIQKFLNAASLPIGGASRPVGRQYCVASQQLMSKSSF